MNWENWAGRQNLASCQAWGTGGRVNRANCPWPVDSLRNGIFTLDTNCVQLTQQERTKAGSGLGLREGGGRWGGEGRPQDATRRRVVLKLRGHTALPLSIPEPRGTFLSPWPPCGCGDEVRGEVGVTRRIATGGQGGLALTPFSLLCKEGPWKSVRQEEGSGAGLRRQPACPWDTETHSNPILPALPQGVENTFSKRIITFPSAAFGRTLPFQLFHPHNASFPSPPGAQAPRLCLQRPPRPAPHPHTFPAVHVPDTRPQSGTPGRGHG